MSYFRKSNKVDEFKVTRCDGFIRECASTNLMLKILYWLHKLRHKCNQLHFMWNGEVMIWYASELQYIQFGRFHADFIRCFRNSNKCICIGCRVAMCDECIHEWSSAISVWKTLDWLIELFYKFKQMYMNYRWSYDVRYIYIYIYMNDRQQPHFGRHGIYSWFSSTFEIKIETLDVKWR